MNKLIVANWKENPKSEKDVLSLLGVFEQNKNFSNNIVICPPFIYLKTINDFINKKKLQKSVLLGAQNVFWEDQGPYTGEISPLMLKNFGIKYVIIGHSERRFWFNETEAIINRKIKATITCGITPIFCVGEPLKVRQKGINAVKNFIGNQIKKSLNDIPDCAKKVVIAYEPLWAIGSKNNAESKDIFDIAVFVKREIMSISQSSKNNPLFLYGGSVDGKNISSYLKYDEINGALVGSASINVKEWSKIIKI